jgi:hypothetical protein
LFAASGQLHSAPVRHIRSRVLQAPRWQDPRPCLGGSVSGGPWKVFRNAGFDSRPRSHVQPCTTQQRREYARRYATVQVIGGHDVGNDTESRRTGFQGCAGRSHCCLTYEVVCLVEGFSHTTYPSPPAPGTRVFQCGLFSERVGEEPNNGADTGKSKGST